MGCGTSSTGAISPGCDGTVAKTKTCDETNSVQQIEREGEPVQMGTPVFSQCTPPVSVELPVASGYPALVQVAPAPLAPVADAVVARVLPQESASTEALAPEQIARSLETLAQSHSAVPSALHLIQSGLACSDVRSRSAALELALESVTQERPWLPDGAAQAAPEFLFDYVLVRLVDANPGIRDVAARTVIAAANSPCFGLEPALERIHDLLQGALFDTTELCGAMCCFLTLALQFFLKEVNDAVDTSMTRVHLQAALWDSAPLVRQALDGAFGPARQEDAAGLAVAVFCRLGVDDSSQLLEGLEPSVVRLLFERFVSEEVPPTFITDSSPMSPTWERDRDLHMDNLLMDEILEEVGVVIPHGMQALTVS